MKEHFPCLLVVEETDSHNECDKISDDFEEDLDEELIEKLRKQYL